MAEMSEGFDEQRFASLLAMAGPSCALELTQRLDEDLSRISQALATAEMAADLPALHAQSHVLLAIAGSVGAEKLHLLSRRLNDKMRAADGSRVSELLADIVVDLGALIQRVRLARKTLMPR